LEVQLTNIAVLTKKNIDEGFGPVGPPGAPGAPGNPGLNGNNGISIVAKGSVATVDLIPAASEANKGWLHTVAATGHSYISNGLTWIDQGDLRGEQGAQGIPGNQGIQGPPADTVVIQGIADTAEQSKVAAAQSATDAETSALAALSAGVVFGTANAALVSADPVVDVEDIFWVRPNATDALTRMTAYRRIGAGTTALDYEPLQSFNSGTEFDNLAKRFKGDISTLDPAQYKRSGYAYAVVGSDRRLIEKRSNSYQRDLLGPLRVPSINGITYLDQRWSRSGIRRGVVGSDRRKIEVESSTNFLFDKPISAPNLLEAIVSQRWARSGKPKATIGSDRRLLSDAAAPAVAAAATPAVTDLYVAYSDNDGTGSQAVYAEQRKTGKRLKLSAAGSNNTNPRIEGNAVIWTSDRAGGAPSGLYWSKPDVVDEHPVRPLRALACFGDSLTAQNWMADLATATPTPVAATAYNFGRSGETSTAVASRYGAYENLYTVAGGSIPASGPVTITNVGKGNMLFRFANVATTLVGYLNGIFGTFVFDGASTTTFTRMTAGDAVASPGNVRASWAPSPTGDNNPAVESGLITNFADMVLIAFMGRNNTIPVQFVLNDFQAMFDRIPTLARRFVFMPYLPAAGAGEIIGTGAYKNRQELVAAMFARWPDNTLDPLPAMQAAYNSGQPQDVTDVANGVTPSSLMKVTDVPADYIHPNAAGRVVIANAVAAFLTSKGFLQ
jgi:hypothetical protein